jgi:hypothetical protein
MKDRIEVAISDLAAAISNLQEAVEQGRVNTDDAARIILQAASDIESSVPTVVIESLDEPDDLAEQRQALSVMDQLLDPNAEPLHLEPVEVPPGMAEEFRQERVWDEYHEVAEQMGEFLASASGGGSSESYDQLEGFEEDLKSIMADIGRLLVSIDFFKEADYEIADQIVQQIKESYEFLDEDNADEEG